MAVQRSCSLMMEKQKFSVLKLQQEGKLKEKSPPARNTDTTRPECGCVCVCSCFACFVKLFCKVCKALCQLVPFLNYCSIKLLQEKGGRN